MKKKILLIVLASFMFMGVVSAANIWGTYKGKQIIRLTVDGSPVKVSDAPAVIMDNRTMIPIYLLKDAGIKYSWDSKNQTVDIKSSSTNTGIDLESLARDVQSYRMFTRLSDQLELVSACVRIVESSFTKEDLAKATEQIERINPNYLILFLNEEYIENESYKKIVSHITDAKYFLSKFDSQSAFDEWYKGKTLLNSIYSGLDDRITNHMGTLYAAME